MVLLGYSTDHHRDTTDFYIFQIIHHLICIHSGTVILKKKIDRSEAEDDNFNEMM